MSIDATGDLENFQQFVGEQLANGGVQLAPELVLAMWRDRIETIKAIREGLDAVNAGRTKPLDQFLSEFRQRHNLSE